MKSFEEKVAAVVRAIPRGEVRSYAQVAMYAGRSGGARSVARALRHAKGLPWWRVIRADGTLAEAVSVEQRRRLAKEGVAVKGRRVVGRPEP